MTAGSRPLVALEISPMQERFHTGIANVSKHLARQLLADDSVEGRFFYHRREVPVAVMEHLIALEGGAILPWLAERLITEPVFSCDPDTPAIGIFTNHKQHRRLFPFEVQVVHDLTSLVTPQFHTEGTIRIENGQRLADLASSDLIVAVSESTRQDILTYHPEIAAIPVIVAHLASCAADPDGGEAPEAEPYVLVLGTLEPRKNVECVLELLSAHPDLLERAAFVFVGRWGWGQSTGDLIGRLGLTEAVTRGRIRFTGFVPDSVRDALLAHARCVVYASRYEGFGLPIIESLGYGVAVVTGYGSSLPEAGGRVAIYCDVTSSDAIGVAIERCLAHDDAALRAERRAQAAKFTWWKTYTTIRDAALSRYHEQGVGP